MVQDKLLFLFLLLLGRLLHLVGRLHLLLLAMVLRVVEEVVEEDLVDSALVKREVGLLWILKTIKK